MTFKEWFYRGDQPKFEMTDDPELNILNAAKAAFEAGRRTSIFAVEAGGYDDYGVRGLFTTEEMAQQQAAAYPATDEATTNEWEIDKMLPQVAQGLKRYSISMANDGTIIDINQRAPENAGPDLVQTDRCLGYRLDSIPEGWEIVDSHSGRATNIYRGPGLLGCVWARDEEHAKHIAEEKRKEHYDV